MKNTPVCDTHWGPVFARVLSQTFSSVGWKQFIYRGRQMAFPHEPHFKSNENCHCSLFISLSVLFISLTPLQMVCLLSAASCSPSSVTRTLSSGWPARTSRRPRTPSRCPPRPRRSMRTSSSLRDPERSATPPTSGLFFWFCLLLFVSELHSQTLKLQHGFTLYFNKSGSNLVLNKQPRTCWTYTVLIMGCWSEF